LAGPTAQGTGRSVDTQTLLQNLDELLSRLREANIVPSSSLGERKP
jgi:hypothetical protein